MTRKSLVLALSLACTVACAKDPQKLKRQYLESGDQYVAGKKYAEAIVQYRNAVAVDPKFGEARFKLAAAYEVTQDLPNALREYVRAADLMPGNVSAQLHAGTLLASFGQFPEAKARAMAALEKNPKNVNALILLGNALAGMKDVDGAISQIEEAVDTQPQFLFSYANLGLLEVKKGDRTAAEGAFKRATEVAPTAVEPHLNLANFYWASGRRAEAERELKSALALDPKSSEINRMLAAFYSIGAQSSEAEPYLKAFADVTPGVDPKFALADYYVRSGKAKEAIDVLQPLTNDHDGFGPAKLRLAVIDFQANRRPQAYQALEEILKRYPKNERTLEAKARFLVADQKFDEALKVASAVVEANPKAVRSHYLRGVALQAKGSSDEAIQALQKVLELAPASIPAQMMLGNIYVSRQDGKAALEYLTPVVKAQPSSSSVHFLFGQALLQSGNVTAAEPELIAVAKANPSSAESQNWLGRLYLAKDDLVRARQAFSRALQLDPKSVIALNGLVTVDIVEKKPEAARSRLEPRLASSPNDVAVLFLAGNSYLTMGDTQRAEKLFRRLLQLDPSNIDAYGRLASLFMTQHRLDEARTELENAARHQAKPVAARTLIGVILEMQNRHDEARRQYEQVLALDARAPVAANNLAWQYAESGQNLDQALQLAQTAKAQLPDNAQVSDTLGWIYYKKGLAGLAVTALRQGAEQAPSAASIHYHLGLAYLKNGDERNARASLNHVLKLSPALALADDAKRVLATIKG